MSMLSYSPKKVKIADKNEKTGPRTGSFIGAPGKIRTCDLQYRKLTLYPAELRVLVVGM